MATLSVMKVFIVLPWPHTGAHLLFNPVVLFSGFKTRGLL